MGVFDFLRNNKEADLPEISEDVFIEKSDDLAKGGARTTMEASLDGVYEFLKADFETRGYNDALINGDSSYRDENIEVLMWDLIILCKHANSKYEDKIVSLDNHIISRRRLGALDVIQELESEKGRITEKIEDLKTIIGFAESRTEAPSRVIKSYQRGFHRGMIALSKSTINEQR